MWIPAMSPPPPNLATLNAFHQREWPVLAWSRYNLGVLAWEEGQFIRLGDGSKCWWNGLEFEAGVAPPAQPITGFMHVNSTHRAESFVGDPSGRPIVLLPLTSHTDRPHTVKAMNEHPILGINGTGNPQKVYERTGRRSPLNGRFYFPAWKLDQYGVSWDKIEVGPIPPRQILPKRRLVDINFPRSENDVSRARRTSVCADSQTRCWVPQNGSSSLMTPRGESRTSTKLRMRWEQGKTSTLRTTLRLTRSSMFPTLEILDNFWLS